MRKLLLATATAAIMAAGASSANAAIVVSGTEQNDLYGTTLPSGMVMLEDFDSIHNANTSFVGNIIEYPDEFEFPDASTTASPPYPGSGVFQGANEVDPTNYASVQGNGESTFSALNGYYLTSFSFYMGSPDTYNRVTFHVLGGPDEVFSGTEIWGGTPQGDGNRANGYRVYYNFNGAKVTSISFASDSNAFEFDGLAGTLAVPEPATWAMMIMGFGAAGSLLRSKRRRLVSMTA